MGIEPEWTLEAAGDLHRVVRDPDPRSRAAYVRIIGYSPGAGFVLTVIVDPDDWSGVTTWKTRGADLREYLTGLRPSPTSHAVVTLGVGAPVGQDDP